MEKVESRRKQLFSELTHGRQSSRYLPSTPSSTLGNAIQRDGTSISNSRAFYALSNALHIRLESLQLVRGNS